jgi:hypothetical protein
MKTIAKTLVGAAVLLGLAGSGEAVVKCPQPNGSVITMPDSVGCSTPRELRNQEAEQAAASQRRRIESQRQQDEAASQQQSAAFIQASEGCTRQVDRYKYGNDPRFKSVARADGTVRMLGTASDRFDYQLCMEKAGHRLDAK